MTVRWVRRAGGIIAASALLAGSVTVAAAPAVSAHEEPDTLTGVRIPQTLPVAVVVLPGGTQVAASGQVVAVPVGAVASVPQWMPNGVQVPWNYRRWGDLTPTSDDCNGLFGDIRCDDAHLLMSTNIADLCSAYASAGFSLARRHHVRERLKELGTTTPSACGFGR